MTNPIVQVVKVIMSDGKPPITMHRYWCPGCDFLHQIAINPDKQANGAGWDFSGTLECPTYSPSQLCTWDYWRDDDGRQRTQEEGPLKKICHTFIRDGQIQFLADCTHALAGQTVPLPPLPDWAVKEGNI
jgi:hypothetical protein